MPYGLGGNRSPMVNQWMVLLVRARAAADIAALHRGIGGISGARWQLAISYCVARWRQNTQRVHPDRKREIEGRERRECVSVSI